MNGGEVRRATWDRADHVGFHVRAMIPRLVVLELPQRVIPFVPTPEEPGLASLR